MVAKKTKAKDLFDLASEMNQYAFVPAEMGLYDIDKWCDTEVYGLNALYSDGDICKGIIYGKRYLIAGENSTAKSLIALQSVAAFQRANAKSRVFYFESEGAITRQHLTEVNVDMKRIKIIPIATIEELRHQSLNIMDAYIEQKKSGEIDYDIMIVVDSLGMLNSEDEDTKAKDGSQTKSMTKTQLIASTYRKLSMRLALGKVPMITIQHVHSKIGGQQNFGGGFNFVPKKEIQGGELLKFVADTILYLSKSNEWDTDKNKIGIKTTVEVYKSRFMKANIKFVLTILYGIGIIKHSSMIQYGLDSGAITISGSWYTNTVNGMKFQKANILDKGDKIFDEITVEAIRQYMLKHYAMFGQDPAGNDEIKSFISDEEDN